MTPFRTAAPLQRGPTPYSALVERTILDVLRDVVGADLSDERLKDLTLDDVTRLAHAVQQHYASWQPPEHDGLRVHLGGWIAGNYAAPEARELLTTMLLYADQLVLHDPLAEWFFADRRRLRALNPIRYRNGAKLAGSEGYLLATDGWVVHRDDLERNLATLTWAIPALRDVAPLIDSGAALLVPHLQLVLAAQESLLVAVRHTLNDDAFVDAVEHPIDLKPITTDFSRGVALELTGAGGLVSDKDRRLQVAGNPAYYVNKTLAVAHGAQAAYMPPSATDWRLYDLRVQAAAIELRRAADLDLKVLAALHTSELPLLADLDLKTISKLRADEGLLEDWRIALRQAARTLTAVPVEGAAFATDSRQLLEDLLGPAERQVAKDQALLGRLKRGGRDASVKLVAGAAGAGVAATVVGGPPAGLITAGVSAAAGWTLGALLPAKHSGIAQVVVHLRQGK